MNHFSCFIISLTTRDQTQLDLHEWLFCICFKIFLVLLFINGYWFCGFTLGILVVYDECVYKSQCGSWAPSWENRVVTLHYTYNVQAYNVIETVIDILRFHFVISVFKNFISRFWRLFLIASHTSTVYELWKQY